MSLHIDLQTFRQHRLLASSVPVDDQSKQILRRIPIATASKHVYTPGIIRLLSKEAKDEKESQNEDKPPCATPPTTCCFDQKDPPPCPPPPPPLGPPSCPPPKELVPDPNNPCYYVRPECLQEHELDLTKLKKKQCWAQSNDDLPIYLKGGRKDAIMVNCIAVFLVVGIVYGMAKVFQKT